MGRSAELGQWCALWFTLNAAQERAVQAEMQERVVQAEMEAKEKTMMATMRTKKAKNDEHVPAKQAAKKVMKAMKA